MNIEKRSTVFINNINKYYKLIININNKYVITEK